MFHILDIHIMLITCETWVGVRVVAGQECIQTGTSQKHTKTSLDTSGGPWEKLLESP